MTLEFMRVIMTGVVFLSHMEFLASYSYGSVYTRFFHNATIGVDYFFLLSGFGLMASSYKSNPICEKSIGGLRWSNATVFEWYAKIRACI